LRTFSQALAQVERAVTPDPGGPRRRHPVIPETSPPDLFRRLRGERRLFFLDSAIRDPKLGSRSYLAFDPLFFLRMTDRRGVLEGPGGKLAIEFEGDPFAAIDALWRFAREKTRGHRRVLRPRGFETGLAGMFGYDLRCHLERLPACAPRDTDMPDLAIGLYDRALVHDPHERSWTSIGSIRRALDVDDLPPQPNPGAAPKIGRVRSSIRKRDYLARVRRIIRRIHEGDVYQVNLSRRLSAPFSGDPAELYLRLRRANPGAYSGYLDTGSGLVLSTSPERFLRTQGRRVTTWPVKGTRPRSEDRIEDARLRRELRASPKDRAELSMIVDLLRNDLHRVARTGSVRVTRHAFARSYASVHHLMSEIVAELAPGVSPVDLLRATFPGGSVTGAPKIRACEIIDALEPVRRGAYTGAMGWIGRDGDCDLGILIRTVQVLGDRLHVHTGGGIVADSDPEAEFEETEHKARAILRGFSPEES
jgi:para-aminobenzoate synthetase component I